MVRWGVGLPSHLPGATRRDILEWAVQAEALGFDSLWAGDRIVFDSLDLTTTLAAVAGITERLTISPTTLIGAARSPVEVAKAWSTLDVLSAGRIRLVVSVGHRADDYAATGQPFAARGARLREFVEVVRLVWSGEAVRYEGSHYSLDVGPVGPRPVQTPGIPLWLAGDSPAARRRAVQLGDGHVSGTAGLATTSRLRREFDDLCREMSRDPVTFPLAATAYFALGDDPRKSLDEGMRNLLRYYDGRFHWDPGTDVIWGTVGEAAERVLAYGAATLETFVFVPSSLTIEQLNRLRDVVTLAEARLSASG